MNPQSESNYRGTGCGKAARPGLKGSGEATNRSTWKLGAALCQVSVSGTGLWGLFRISNPERYEDHFRSLYAVFENCDMIIDKSCKDIARLRGYSFDEHTRINPDGIHL